MEVPGLRVIRGPDWKDKDIDGGECHVGTVTRLLSNHMVMVSWDMGQESICCTGQDGKYDLRILDTAQVGVCHQDVSCTECGEKSFYGPLWRCQSCSECNLCSFCYCNDKHNMGHPFLRIDKPGFKGLPIPNRKTSVKNCALGIYPGAKVTRGNDWQWRDQDGGEGSEGEVIGYENVVPDSSRNLVKVQWPNGNEHCYRLGFQGYVDLKCVDEELGPYYYRDHLPVLDTLSASLPEDSTLSLDDPSTSREQNRHSSPVEYVEAELSETSTKDSDASERLTVAGENGKTKDSGIVVDKDIEKEGLAEASGPEPSQTKEKKVDDIGKSADVAEEESFLAGQRVAIKVSENSLLEMLDALGGGSEDYTEVMGCTGEVIEMTSEGTVSVRFDSANFTFPPDTLTKVFDIKEGATVHVREKEEEVKTLNSRVGWKEEMTAIIGKAGRVLKIDSDGDLLVTFGRHHYMFAPAACIPAPETRPLSLKKESDEKLPISDEKLPKSDEKLPKVIAQTAVSDEKRDSSGAASEASKHFLSAEDTKELFSKLKEKVQTESTYHRAVDAGSFFSAINKGENSRVRALCLADRSMVEKVYKDLTPLVLACVKGHLEVVKTLIDFGADPNHGLPPFKTPLSGALESRSEEIVDVLLKAGADAFQVDPRGHTYVHLAAAFDLSQAIRALASAGVDLNIKDDYSDTALHMAIEKFQHKAVETLVQLEGTDLCVENKRDFPALHVACLKGNARAVELILEQDKSQVDFMHHGRNTPLHISANNDHDECIRVLVLLGKAQVNIQDGGGAAYAPIHLACIRAKFRAVEALLEVGADVQVQDNSGDTPLHLTVGGRLTDSYESEQGKQECQLRVAIACMLISNGAYVDVENHSGRNPFKYGVPPVRSGIQRFMEHNPDLVKRKGYGMSHMSSISMENSIKSLAMPQALSSSIMPGLAGQGNVSDALKGMVLPCGVCSADKSDVTLKPCQHKCVCSSCSPKVVRCPLCDVEVKEKEVTGSDGPECDPDACKQM